MTLVVGVCHLHMDMYQIKQLNNILGIKRIIKMKKLNNTSGHGEIYAFGDIVRPLEIKASVYETGNYREAV